MVRIVKRSKLCKNKRKNNSRRNLISKRKQILLN